MVVIYQTLEIYLAHIFSSALILNGLLGIKEQLSKKVFARFYVHINVFELLTKFEFFYIVVFQLYFL